MMHLQAAKESDNHLSREVWNFWYYDNRHAIVLDAYRQESRPSLRHKFKVDAMYNRLRSRDATIEEADVPMPEDIIKNVMEQFTASLRVCKWEETKT